MGRRFSQANWGLKPEAVNVREFIDRVRRMNERVLEHKRLTLKVQLQTEREQVALDPRRMEQVLDNLLNNACKFSPADTTITLTASHSGNEWLFSVADEGPGITEEEHEGIFQEFTQARARATGEERGAGLGLAICKKIVELHGGRIGLTSEPGKGAVFTIHLPEADG